MGGDYGLHAYEKFFPVAGAAIGIAGGAKEAGGGGGKGRAGAKDFAKAVTTRGRFSLK